MNEVLRFCLMVAFLGIVMGIAGYELLVRFLTALIPYVNTISTIF